MSELIDAAAPLPAGARLRSGTAARLAGVPVATLRVWERRYAVVAAPKTPTGQRLYSAHDVQRLRLLRQLSEAGHGIGTIAVLDLPALQALAAGEAPVEAPPRRLWVVGRAAAQRLRGERGIAVTAEFETLEQAEAAAAGGAAAAAEVLVLQLPSLPPDAAPRVAALRARSGAVAALLVYAFGAGPALEALHAAGVVVRREPLAARELPRWVAMAAAAPQASAAPVPAQLKAQPVAPRRYSDEAMAALAELPSTVACECPRHLAEIVQQLVAFERYSADCLSRSPADAELHAALAHLAGHARALFEEAVSRVVVAEGLVLPPGEGVAA